MTGWRHLALAAASLLGLGACGGHVPVREAETAHESRLGWPRERCEEMARPDSLPRLSQLADSARLHRELDAHEGPLSFGVTVSARGDVESVRLLHSAGLPTELQREREDRLYNALVRQPPSTGAWTVRVSRSDEGAWQVQRGVYCSPRVAQGAGRTRFYGSSRPVGARAIEVRVSVTETGFGQAVSFPVPPPNRELEAVLRQQAMTLRFLPAMLNGEPVPSVFTYFVSLRRASPFRR